MAPDLQGETPESASYAQLGFYPQLGIVGRLSVAGRGYDSHMRSSSREEIVEVFDALDADLNRALALTFDALTTPEGLAMLERCEKLRRQLPTVEHPTTNRSRPFAQFVAPGQYTVMASCMNGRTCSSVKPCDSNSPAIFDMATLNGLGCPPKRKVYTSTRERPSSSHRSCAMAISRSGGPMFNPSFDSKPRNWASGVSALATAAATNTAAAAAIIG
jgi:hypothetical protein